MTLHLAAVAGELFVPKLRSGNGDVDSLPGFVRAVDLQKMWQALSILTTPGSDPELTLVTDPHPLDPVLGGTEIGPDLGYGPRRWFSPAEVVEIDRHLSSLDDDAVRARFDPQAFEAASVYPFCWDEDPDELWEDELVVYLGELRGLYAEAASGGLAVVADLR